MDDPHFNQEHERRVDGAQGEVLKLLNKLIPKGWQMAMFQIDVAADEACAPPRITHRLWNPMTDQEVFDFSDELFSAIGTLNGHFVRNGQHWKRGLFLFERAPGNRQEIRTNYLFIESGGPKPPFRPL